MGVKKLSMVEKVRIMAWREEGSSASDIIDHLGCPFLFIKLFLVKSRALPSLRTPFPR
jgi:hypothetical protein